jgi:hypothetical protein
VGALVRAVARRPEGVDETARIDGNGPGRIIAEGRDITEASALAHVTEDRHVDGVINTNIR